MIWLFLAMFVALILSGLVIYIMATKRVTQAVIVDTTHTKNAKDKIIADTDAEIQKVEHETADELLLRIRNRLPKQ